MSTARPPPAGEEEAGRAAVDLPADVGAGAGGPAEEEPLAVPVYRKGTCRDRVSGSLLCPE